MTRRQATLALTVLAAACGGVGSGAPSPAPRELPAGVEAVSLLGDTLRAPALPDDVRARYEERLAGARTDAERRGHDVESLIWIGRRTAYLGRYREAIGIYTRALERFPDDARLLRHRGHRWLTVRRLDLAVADLERAARLISGRPDEIEPDGLPNARNVPTSTLHSNIRYHLGLAHYLRGDFSRALEQYRTDVRLASNPDMLVASSHWLYMTLRRMGRDADAAAVLTPITRDLDVIENGSYHRLLLMYRGELAPDSLLAAGASPLEDATVGYGVGNWHLYNGRPAEAERVFRRILAGGQWASFGYLAAEAEIARGTTRPR